MATAQPQQSPNIMSMAIRDPSRSLYQVAFNDGVSGLRVEVPFSEASSVQEARIKAEHTLQYQEWLRLKRLREHKVRQLVFDYSEPSWEPQSGEDDLTGIDPNGLADRLIELYADKERANLGYGVGTMLRHTLVLLEASTRILKEGEWSLSYAFSMLDDLRLIRTLCTRMPNRVLQRDAALEDAVRYWKAVRQGRLSPGMRDQLRRRGKAWLSRFMSANPEGS